MRHPFSLLLTMALLLGLCACTPQSAPAPTPVAVSPYLEDYDTFWRIVEESYPLYAVAERVTGEDFGAVKARYRPFAETAKSPEDLAFYLEKCAEKFQFTGHLRLFDKNWYAYMMNAFRGSTDRKAVYEYDRLNNPTSRAFYGYTATTVPVDSGGVQSADRLSSSTGNLLFGDYPEEKTGYVELQSMDYTGFAQDKAELDAFFTRLEEEGYRDCIVDIRRNSGGSSPYGIDAIAVPNSTQVPTRTHYALVRGGQEVLDYLDVVKDVWSLHPIAELPAAALPKLNADDLALATHYFTMDVGCPSGAVAESSAPLFTGKFWLLTSERVYSASEYFAVFCKDTGFATLVGTPTGGDGVGLNPFVHALPNTGICFQFSAENGLNLDGSCNEEFGTAPDIAVTPDQDALEVCLAAIKAG